MGIFSIKTLVGLIADLNENINEDEEHAEVYNDLIFSIPDRLQSLSLDFSRS